MGHGLNPLWSMWKAVGKSVIGTAHEKGEIPCQDFSDYWQCRLGDEKALIIGISDGAGSATLSHVGSKEAIGFIMRQVTLFEESTAHITREHVQGWFAKTLEHLQETAKREQLESKELACTLLLAILGKNHAVFAQIGDGAWVMEKNETVHPVTWPYNGEFANETKFITSADAFEFLQFQKLDEPLTAVAGFTDGIQALALNYADKSVHVPFFAPIFTALRDCEDQTSLLSPLIHFLSSEKVNERTDDDKTLVVAGQCASKDSDDVLD
jgi:hypothetical protein